MKTFELLLADETDEVYAISLVEKGAIEKDFVWFGKEDIKFAKQTGLNKFYLWGVEWWYWIKVKYNEPEIWNQAKTLFKTGEV